MVSRLSFLLILAFSGVSFADTPSMLPGIPQSIKKLSSNTIQINRDLSRTMGLKPGTLTTQQTQYLRREANGGFTLEQQNARVKDASQGQRVLTMVHRQVQGRDAVQFSLVETRAGRQTQKTFTYLTDADITNSRIVSFTAPPQMNSFAILFRNGRNELIQAFYQIRTNPKNPAHPGYVRMNIQAVPGGLGLIAAR